MSNTQRTPQQFKPGDRVKVGAPTEDDQYDCGKVAREGAVGFLFDFQPDGSWLVQFAPRDPLVNKCHDWRWFIDPRRLTLVDEQTVEPAVPLPIMARDMTLHDWFAGQALKGLLASQTPESHWAFSDGPESMTDDRAKTGVAMLCHDLATATMERREK